jgi:tripartite-type tricarboxylate transporter receptor subunit TctC
MKIEISRRNVLAGIAASATAFHSSARADAFPSRPIQIIVPFAAGGGSDRHPRRRQPARRAARPAGAGRDPAVTRLLIDRGFDPVGGGADVLAKAIKSDDAKYGKLIKERGIRIN